MGVEFELKFSATPDQLAQIAAAYPLPYRTIQMETTYFDTSAFSLSDRRITLRRRMENGEPVCTVKTPVAGYGRGEWECQCDDIMEGVLELCKLGAPKELLLLTVEGVAPVCGAKYTRRAGDIHWGEARLELALDRGILTGGGKEVDLCEVEVELKAGTADVAVQFAMALAERFGLSPQKKSKFRRALALARGE